MSNYKDKEFLQIIDKGIEHCNRGDVFQIVLSRRFWQDFRGDEFNVYRALRSINPSPYLFYLPDLLKLLWGKSLLRFFQFNLNSGDEPKILKISIINLKKIFLEGLMERRAR